MMQRKGKKKQKRIRDQQITSICQDANHWQTFQRTTLFLFRHSVVRTDPLSSPLQSILRQNWRASFKNQPPFPPSFHHTCICFLHSSPALQNYRPFFSLTKRSQMKTLHNEAHFRLITFCVYLGENLNFGNFVNSGVSYN